MRWVFLLVVLTTFVDASTFVVVIDTDNAIRVSDCRPTLVDELQQAFDLADWHMSEATRISKEIPAYVDRRDRCIRIAEAREHLDEADRLYGLYL